MLSDLKPIDKEDRRGRIEGHAHTELQKDVVDSPSSWNVAQEGGLTLCLRFIPRNKT